MVKELSIKISDDSKEANLDITTFEGVRYTIVWNSELKITAKGEAGGEVSPCDDQKVYKDLDQLL